MVVILVVLAVVVTAFAGLTIVGFNRLQRARHAVREAWAQIDVMLSRRHHLVNELAAVAKAYAAFEREALDQLMAARSVAEQESRPARKGDAEEDVDRKVDGVLARAEDYPQLRADETFDRLARELVQSEEDVAAARRYYNGRVRLYHNTCQSFPNSLVAGMLGFGRAEYFQADREAREAPSVA